MSADPLQIRIALLGASPDPNTGRRRLQRTKASTPADRVWGGYPFMGRSVLTSASTPTLRFLRDFSTPPVS